MYNLLQVTDECEMELELLNIPFRKPKYVLTDEDTIWGQCVENPDKSYTVYINKCLLHEENSISALKETVLHELLHTCTGCMNHGKKWSGFANRLNSCYFYNIKQESTAKDKGVVNESTTLTYILRCTDCNARITRNHECSLTREPWRFTCSRCGGSIVKVNF